MSDFLGKGTAFPFTVVNNKFRMSSDVELVEESIRIILGTEKGERLMRPDFGAGLNELAFSENSLTTATILANKIQDVLEEFEPRIEVLDVNVNPDEDEGNKLFIDIEYKILTSNSKRNLVYPLFLQGAP